MPRKENIAFFVYVVVKSFSVRTALPCCHPFPDLGLTHTSPRQWDEFSPDMDYAVLIKPHFLRSIADQGGLASKEEETKVRGGRGAC